MSTRKWVVPLVAALAVLAVIAVVWSQRPGAESNDVGVADGGSDAGQGEPPYAGTEPGSPGGSLEPVPGSPPGDDGYGAVGPDQIAVDSYYPYDARRLALNYTNGVPECYGTAGTPEVEETPDAVIVTIPRIPPKDAKDKACIDIAMMSTVDITLGRPLSGRAVLDGSRDNAKVKPAAAPHDPDQAM